MQNHHLSFRPVSGFARATCLLMLSCCCCSGNRQEQIGQKRHNRKPKGSARHDAKNWASFHVCCRCSISRPSCKACSSDQSLLLASRSPKFQHTHPRPLTEKTSLIAKAKKAPCSLHRRPRQPRRPLQRAAPLPLTGALLVRVGFRVREG